MARRAVYCPKGCGSMNFRAQRDGSISEEFSIDEDTGEIVRGGQTLAEGGHRLSLVCDGCGHGWHSQRDLDLALFIEGR